jgi:hypothetical protein
MVSTIAGEKINAAMVAFAEFKNERKDIRAA